MNPDTLAANAFTQNWGNVNNWMVPPIYYVIMCIKHLTYCRARSTLIVPKWKSTAYRIMIFGKNLEFQPYVKEVLECRDKSDIYIRGRNENTILSSKPFITPVLAVLLDTRFT